MTRRRRNTMQQWEVVASITDMARAGDEDINAQGIELIRAWAQNKNQEEEMVWDVYSQLDSLQRKAARRYKKALNDYYDASDEDEPAAMEAMEEAQEEKDDLLYAEVYWEGSLEDHGYK